jgi:hypothetical protein
MEIEGNNRKINVLYLPAAHLPSKHVIFTGKTGKYLKEQSSSRIHSSVMYNKNKEI